VFCRCDWRELRVRCAEGERGVRRAREPDVEVARIGEGLAVKPSVSSSLVAVVMRLGGRRVRVEGKWPVWKVVWWRRRVPDMDFGSEMDVSSSGPPVIWIRREG